MMSLGVPMARISPVDSRHIDSYIENVLEAQKKTWGAPLANHLIYARRPSIFKGVRAMWTGIDASGLISASLRALINRRVAAINHCEF
jgi:hypothetical protein